jgi:hypothetical protein
MKPPEADLPRLLVEQTLKPKVDPPGGQPSVVQGLRVFDITVDVATGQLTPAAYGFAAAELDSILQDKTQGISQAELDKIQAAIRARRSSTDAGDHSV